MVDGRVCCCGAVSICQSVTSRPPEQCAVLGGPSHVVRAAFPRPQVFLLSYSSCRWKMCQVTDLASALLIPRKCGSKHQRRAAVNSVVEEVRARKQSFSSVAPRFLTTCINSANLRVMDLSFNKLTQLPAAVILVTTLERLYINGNEMTAIPSDIGNLRNLKLLDCSGNQIRSLPASIGRLSALEVMRIGGPGCGNHIQCLPMAMTGMHALREFIADNNMLFDLSPITECRELRILNAHANQISSLPEGIKHLRNLRRLDVSNNRIKHFPATLCDARLSLEYVNMCNNELDSIPYELTRTSIRILLAGNPVLDVELGPRFPLPAPTASPPSLLECALRSGPLIDNITIDLPAELMALVRDASTCSLCRAKCLNALKEPLIVGARTMGHAVLAAEVATACTPCLTSRTDQLYSIQSQSHIYI